MAKYDITSLRSLLLAGERSEPGIIKIYQSLLSKLAAPGAIVNDKYATFLSPCRDPASPKYC